MHRRLLLGFSRLAPNPQKRRGPGTRPRPGCGAGAPLAQRPQPTPQKTYPHSLARPHTPSQPCANGQSHELGAPRGETSGWQERYPSAGAIVTDSQRTPRGCAAQVTWMGHLMVRTYWPDVGTVRNRSIPGSKRGSGRTVPASLSHAPAKRIVYTRAIRKAANPAPPSGTRPGATRPAPQARARAGPAAQRPE